MQPMRVLNRSCLMFAALPILAVLLGAASPAQDGVGTLTVKIGRVEVTRAGATQPNPAEKGMILFEGDRIRTGELSRTAILLDDGSLIRLKDNSELVLKEKKAGKQRTRLQLMLGRLWAKVTQQENQLEIETPTAVAAIKGTQLELFIAPDGQVSLIVWDGLVNFSNALGAVLVHASQQSLAGKDKAPGEAQNIDLKKMEQWFETVVEVPATQTLKAVVKDKEGKEVQLNLKYNKK